MEITLEVHREGASYWSHVVEFPGCFASGFSLSELHEAVGEAIGHYVWDVPTEIVAGEVTVGLCRIEVAEPPGRVALIEPIDRASAPAPEAAVTAGGRSGEARVRPLGRLPSRRRPDRRGRRGRA